ncbi:MAG: rRNA maturation RNase YbeY [Filifactoraceae bacterium]
MVELLCDIEGYEAQVNEGFTLMAVKVCEKALEIDNFMHDAEVSLSFVSNDEIKKINKKFRKKDTKTDVLSFPLNVRSEIVEFSKKREIEYVPLGDIIISLEQAQEQSIEYNHSLDRELLYLVCHSMLHLLGYDHMTIEDRELMREKEDVILDSLGITRDF